MSKCVECGNLMDRFEAEQYLECAQCRRTVKRVKKIKDMHARTIYDSRINRPVGDEDEYVPTKHDVAEAARLHSWARQESGKTESK